MTSRPVPRFLAPLLVFAGSSLGLYLLQTWFRGAAAAEQLYEGYRFQAWSSNWMMQTLGIDEMNSFGLRALWYDHIYPPGLDAIRYLLMQPETSNGLPPDQVAVDMRLYVVYVLIYGLLNALVFIWVRDLTKSGWWALGGAALWAIYPGHLMMTMLLEPSELSLLMVSLMYFFLYRFLKTRRAGYVPLFLLALFAASMSRSFIQVYVLVIIIVAVVSFWFMTKERAKAWPWQVVNVVLIAVIFIHPVKQFVMYDTWSTTSFGGYHRVGMLFLYPTSVPEPEYPQEIVDNALAFSSHYNTQETIKDNYRLEAAANAFIREYPYESVRGLVKSLTITIPEALRPTAGYVQNFLVEGLPWTTPYNWLFSSWRYLLLVAAAAALIIRARGRHGSWVLCKRYAWFAVFYALIAIPVLWSNRYFPDREGDGPIWTDAMRQKIFLEVPVYVLLTYALWLTFGAKRLSIRRGKDDGPANSSDSQQLQGGN